MSKTAPPARTRGGDPGSSRAPSASGDGSAARRTGGRGTDGRGTGARGTDGRGAPRRATASTPASRPPRARRRGRGDATGTEGRPPGRLGRRAKAAERRSRRAVRREKGLGQYLVRPDIDGPKVRLGILWFLVAVAAVLFGRWATTALWTAVAAAAATQTTKVWLQVPRTAGAPGWSPVLAAVAAAVMTGVSGVGTGAAGVALLCVPMLVLLVHMAAGHKPAVAGAALIGTVLAAVPAMAVVLVVRAELWSGLFLVVAVSFYDAGYFISTAESSSRIEGPLTGVIGLLAVTFAASAIEAAPFDRMTAWLAGAVLALSCPLGQMVVSAYLPERDAKVPAMRRLDAYLFAAPLMLVAVWILTR